MKRAVVDTNIFIAGVLTSEGVAGRLISAWRQQRFTVVTSEPILQELARVCHYPKLTKYKPDLSVQVGYLIELLLKRAVVTSGTTNLQLVTDDPSDDRFIVAAIEGGAQYIVSSDKHLKQLRSINQIKVVNPGQFLKILSEG